MNDLSKYCIGAPVVVSPTGTTLYECAECGALACGEILHEEIADWARAQKTEYVRRMPHKKWCAARRALLLNEIEESEAEERKIKKSKRKLGLK